MDMGSRPAGQTSLEIGSQDGAGETDEENGWPGPSHPLDRDREGVIETNMDQEEDNNERASPVDNSSIAPLEPLDEAGKLDMDVESKEVDDSSEDEDEEKRQEEGEIHPETVREPEQGQNEVEDFEKIPAEQYDQEVGEQQVEDGQEEQAEQHQEEQAGESEPEEEPVVMRIENEMPAAVEPVVVCSSAVAADVDFVPQQQKEEEAEEDLVKPVDLETEEAADDGSEMESLKPGMDEMEEVRAEPSAAPASAASLEVDQVAGDSANHL